LSGSVIEIAAACDLQTTNQNETSGQVAMKFLFDERLGDELLFDCQ
jgi:hypothetical protein